VLENVALPLQIRRVPRDTRRTEAVREVPRFGLSGFENAYPHEVSGGMRQRAALLRAVIAGADALVLDEPFGALDTLTRLRLQDWLRGLMDDLGGTLLFVTHDLDEAVTLSDRVVVLSERPATTVGEIRVGLNPEQRATRLAGPFIEAKERLMALVLDAVEGAGMAGEADGG